jgi:hypothetical protein
MKNGFDLKKKKEKEIKHFKLNATFGLKLTSFIKGKSISE